VGAGGGGGRGLPRAHRDLHTGIRRSRPAQNALLVPASVAQSHHGNLRAALVRPIWLRWAAGHRMVIIDEDDRLQQLEQQKREAIAAEDFELCAQIRDEISRVRRHHRNYELPILFVLTRGLVLAVEAG
jgi:hypothetical protein